MVRYRVKPERVEENVELVRAVFDEFRRTEPEGLRYATFRLDDGVTFVHLAVMENGAGPLSTLKAFQEFKKDLDDRTDEGPFRTEFDLIGSFRLVRDWREH